MKISRPLLPQLLRTTAVVSTLVLLSSCTTQQTGSGLYAAQAQAADLEWLAFRVRSDFNAPLNADSGWAAPQNSAAELTYDRPFRLRTQVRADMAPAQGHLLSLQYRRAGGNWMPVGFAEFPYPSFATPVVSMISTQAYQHGDDAERLLGQPDTVWDDGAGLSGVAATPVWRTVDEALEWEWPLVIRRFSDGPFFAEDNEVFEFRLVDGNGSPLVAQNASAQATVKVTVSAAARDLGGTFIETPSRIGPYQSDRGHLYFFIEPSETDNRFMAVKSTDSGLSWLETNGENRPATGDLEGVASVQTGSTVHIIHQISEEVLYHQFVMDGANSTTGEWKITDESIATPEEPPTQFVDVVARADGSLVTVYAGAHKLFMQIRSAQGVWGQPQEIDTHTAPDLSGPALAIAADDTITLAYTGKDGSAFIRHLYADNSWSERQLLSSNTGTTDPENGAIVPMVVIPQSGTTVVIYREQTGLLYERRFSRDGQLSPPVQISPLPVVTSAVDADQVAADLVLHGSSLHLLFIEERSRSIYYSRSDQPGVWSEPTAIIENVDAGWVRGSVHRDASGNAVYGFVYDAGSTGGSGFNRYFSLPL